MASQIGETRIYTSLEEKDDKRKVKCALCHVYAVPRGIIDSGTNALGDSETHCPNCGHIHGRANH